MLVVFKNTNIFVILLIDKTYFRINKKPPQKRGFFKLELKTN